MKKVLIVAATAVVVVGASALAWHAVAQPHWRYGHWNATDMSAFAEARIAALKAGLTLTPEQEKLWPPVESALRDLAKKRIGWHEAAREHHTQRDRAAAPVDPIARLREGAERLNELGADLSRLAAAADPLYQSLDEAQKRRLEVLMQRGSHGMRHHGRRFGFLGDEGRRHPGMHGPMDWHQRTGWERRPEPIPGAERL